MTVAAAKRKKPTKPTKGIDHIHIKGAQSNNLKNIELKIPKGKLIAVTGLSGSGKSSLIMDTLYAEGQRRYVESLSSYARQFLSRMKKPEVDFIKGLCPAIAIEQKVTTGNARSTVGSMTEIFDYLRLFFARVGRTYSPVSGKEVKKHQVSDVVDFLQKLKDGTKVQLLFPMPLKYADRTVNKALRLLVQKGFTRIVKRKKIEYIEDILEKKTKWLDKRMTALKEGEIMVLVDRFVISDDEENIKRIADSVQTAFYEGEGELTLDILDTKKEKSFNNRFELDGITFLEPSQQLFNYNNPYGACKTCEGYGRIIGIDPYKVIPEESLSIYDGAVACWKGEKTGKWLSRFISNTQDIEFPIHRPYSELSEVEVDILWNGSKGVEGIYDFFGELESKAYKIQNRVMMARYRGRTTCTECEGSRLRKEASYVKVKNKSIQELVDLPIDELLDFFKKIKLSAHDKSIAKRILIELTTRLQTMIDVGLSYLMLDRISSTLSGGETQRINLTRTLSSNLTNSLYILDEPSIGLHPKDTGKLVKVLTHLRELNNTVIVVEHEEEVINNADYIIDVGPLAGIFGGEIVYNGTFKAFKKSKSLTADYIFGKKQIPVPPTRRKFSNKLVLKGAKQNNLQNVSATFPLNTMTVVTGVSGSGKTTLVKQILYPALKKKLGEIVSMAPGTFDSLKGDFKMITKVEMINQSPIGKSSRSNPATYVKAYDAIRALYASQQASKIKGFQAKHFSFNVDGGRCEKCKGEGEETVEMQFLADVKLICEDCRGRRFKQEVLEVEYKGKSIFDVLNLSIVEALGFFKERKDIYKKILPLDDVGLGYVKLGQSSNTLSGGEAQRVKLASYLGKEQSTERIFFIFDEPTTGLHFHDINKLLDAMNALVEKGHTVLIVEHNMEIIKSADWVIDLGPDGGKGGGQLLFEGRPEDLIKIKESYTAQYLKEKLK
ncbi:excinuclease ABC subunit UvrA [Saprospiraceae bacterium]|nr:excinuclease ABC subunit UvrA [Saprospiraceae bacterium]